MVDYWYMFTFFKVLFDKIMNWKIVWRLYEIIHIFVLNQRDKIMSNEMF